MVSNYIRLKILIYTVILTVQFCNLYNSWIYIQQESARTAPLCYGSLRCQNLTCTSICTHYILCCQQEVEGAEIMHVHIYFMKLAIIILTIL